MTPRGPWRITFTGVDEFTRLDALQALAAGHPQVEWAALVRLPVPRSLHNPRYPSLPWLVDCCERWSAQGTRFALHFCGQAVGLLLRQEVGCATTQALLRLAWQADRVQLNLRAGADEAAAVRALADRLAGGGRRPVQLILPWNPRTLRLWDALGPAAADAGLACLVDRSGGRGLLPAHWPSAAQLPGCAAGYAGGIGPQNMAAVLTQLDAAADGQPYWVDMESGVRSADNRFDLTACEAVLRAVAHRRTGGG